MYATLRPSVFHAKGRNKITAPVLKIPHPDANTVKASHQKERLGSVATDHSLNQNAPIHNTIGADMHYNVDTPVSDIDRKKVSTNVDNGDDMKHRNVKESHENDDVQKFSHTSEVRPVDQHSKPHTVLSEAKQLHNEPKIIPHDHHEKAQGLQQERNILEMQQEQKITVEEVEEQRTATQEQHLEKKTIPKVQNMKQESTVSQEGSQKVQQMSKETPMDDRLVKILNILLTT